VTSTQRIAILIGFVVLLGWGLGSGCGTRENPPSSKAGNASRSQDSLTAAARADTVRGPASDPRAVALAQRLLAALGGERSWDAARCWYFTYAVGDARGERLRRTHYWERTTGRHRLEGTDRRQRPFIVIHTLGDSAAAIALRSGAPVSDPAEKWALCRVADSLWVNDSTWLFLPFKLRDRGAKLAYGGTENEGDKTWDLIEVAFDSQPLAPSGRHRLYVDRTTAMLERTAMVEVQESSKKKRGKRAAGTVVKSTPVVYEWVGWRIFGGVLLAGERRAVGSGPSILFPQLAVLDAFPASVFTAPEPVVLPAL
jgi:hypothetical protein